MTAGVAAGVACLGRVALHKPQLADAHFHRHRSDPRLARFQRVPNFAPFKKVRLPLVPGRNNVKDAVRYLRLACSDRQASWWSLGCPSQGKATSRYLHSGERRHHQQWQDHNSSEMGRIQYVIDESARHSFKP